MKIHIEGANEHNLKNVDVTFYDGLTVVTGVSGSGKTSLVFDTLYHEARRRFQEIFSRKGYRVLGWVEVGFVQLYSSRDFKDLDELRRTRMWVWRGEKIIQEVFTSLGFRSLIPLQLPDVLQSLQVGMVDSFFGPCYTTVALQWYTYARAMTHDTFSYTPAAMLVTEKFFNSLPDELKPAFRDPWRELLPRLNLARDRKTRTNASCAISRASS